jgi:tetratricopeptide (TPR) repeat protein
MQAHYLLMNIYGDRGDAMAVKATAAATLISFPGDTTAQSWLTRAATLKAPAPSADTFLNESLALYRMGKFDDSIQAAREALKLRPDYPAAWNNIAAAYNSLGKWDDGIQAGQQAVRLDPNFQLAKNNLAWAIGEKRKAQAAH